MLTQLDKPFARIENIITRWEQPDRSWLLRVPACTILSIVAYEALACVATAYYLLALGLKTLSSTTSFVLMRLPITRIQRQGARLWVWSQRNLPEHILRPLKITLFLAATAPLSPFLSYRYSYKQSETLHTAREQLLALPRPEEKRPAPVATGISRERVFVGYTYTLVALGVALLGFLLIHETQAYYRRRANLGEKETCEGNGDVWASWSSYGDGQCDSQPRLNREKKAECKIAGDVWKPHSWSLNGNGACDSLPRLNREKKAECENAGNKWQPSRWSDNGDGSCRDISAEEVACEKAGDVWETSGYSGGECNTRLRLKREEKARCEKAGDVWDGNRWNGDRYGECDSSPRLIREEKEECEKAGNIWTRYSWSSNGDGKCETKPSYSKEKPPVPPIEHAVKRDNESSTVRKTEGVTSVSPIANTTGYSYTTLGIGGLVLASAAGVTKKLYDVFREQHEIIERHKALLNNPNPLIFQLQNRVASLQTNVNNDQATIANLHTAAQRDRDTIANLQNQAQLPTTERVLLNNLRNSANQLPFESLRLARALRYSELGKECALRLMRDRRSVSVLDDFSEDSLVRFLFGASPTPRQIEAVRTFFSSVQNPDSEDLVPEVSLKQRYIELRQFGIENLSNQIVTWTQEQIRMLPAEQ